MPESKQLLLAADALDACREAEALVADTAPRTVDHETAALALSRLRKAYEQLARDAQLSANGLVSTRATIESARSTLSAIRSRYGRRRGSAEVPALDDVPHTQPRFPRIVTFPSVDVAFRDHVHAVLHAEIPDIAPQLQASLRTTHPAVVVSVRERLAGTGADPGPVWYVFRDGGVIPRGQREEPSTEPLPPHRHGSRLRGEGWPGGDT